MPLRSTGRTLTASLVRQAATAISTASSEAVRHGLDGTAADLDMIFLELLRVESSLFLFGSRTRRALAPEAEWLRPPGKPAHPSPPRPRRAGGGEGASQAQPGVDEPLFKEPS